MSDFSSAINSAMTDWNYKAPVGIGIFQCLKKKQFKAILSIDQVKRNITGEIEDVPIYAETRAVLMSSFRDPITRNMHRMLIEDVILMERDQKCIMYIAPDHELIQSDSIKCNIIECILSFIG